MTNAPVTRSLTQAILYFIGGAFFMVVTFSSVALAVWGVPIHPLIYVAFVSSGFLMAAAILSLLKREKSGRIVALCSLLGISPVWAAWVASVVPQHNIIPGPLSYLVVLAYLVLCGFAVLFPTRLRFATTILIFLGFIGISIGAGKYIERLRAGEYDRPGIACFRWYPSQGSKLIVERDPFGWIDSRVRAVLEQAEIHGTLEWTAASGERTSPNRAIVLAQRKPTSSVRLYNPRNGVIVYASSGDGWQKFPAGAATYSSFFTLENEQGRTMLYERNAETKQGTEAF